MQKSAEQRKIMELTSALRWVEHYHQPPRSSLAPATMVYTVVWLILDGKSEIKIDSETYELKPGDVVVFAPGMRKEWMSPEPSIKYLALSCVLKIGVFDLVKLYQFPVVTSLTITETLEPFTKVWMSLFDEVNGISQTVSNDRKQRPFAMSMFISLEDVSRYFLCNALFLEWVHELLALMMERIPDNASIDPYIQSAVRFIQTRLNERLMVDDVARGCYMSPSQLHKRFIEYCGLSPMSYIRYLRMKTAKQLLISTEMPLKRIAQEIGFENQQSFSRMFRSEEGTSPSEFRRNARDQQY